MTALDRAIADLQNALKSRGVRGKCAAGEGMPPSIRKYFRLKEIGPAGVFEAYASTFDGIPDCENDTICKGAFSATIIENRGSVPLCWQHDLRDPIGRATELEEDGFGLKFRGRLELASARGREAHAFLRNQGLDSFSIGYMLPADGYTRRSDGGRDLRRIDLHEISLVTVACNGRARVI